MASSTEAVSTPAIADHPVRAPLLLGSLGVVFGDIGTSPIYAVREALRAAGGPSEAAVFGVLLLVFWAIVLVVALKYVVFVMRADNEGEGGTMALLSLALPVAGQLRAGLRPHDIGELWPVRLFDLVGGSANSHFNVYRPLCRNDASLNQ
jgi:KUP system potassium uptake protein